MSPVGDREVVAARLRAAGSVFAEDEADVLVDSATSRDELEVLVSRRVDGEPLEVVVGWVAFAGHRLVVAPGVFVPRRRTELLARLAVEAATARGRPVVVEVCCGVAPVAGVVARSVPSAQVLATDVDPACVGPATANLGDRGTVLVGDLLDAVPAELLGTVDVLAANAPYVPRSRIATMPPEARDHEPHRSLDGGPDGVDLHRRLAADCRRWLAPQAVVLVETSRRQASLTADAFRAAGLAVEVLGDDDLDATVVRAVGR